MIDVRNALRLMSLLRNDLPNRGFVVVAERYNYVDHQGTENQRMVKQVNTPSLSIGTLLAKVGGDISTQESRQVPESVKSRA